MLKHVDIRVFHMFGAIGGGARGFKRAKPRVGTLQGIFRCLGSVDVDAGANRNFARLVGAPATTLDLADREQYIAINGRQPPDGWTEATPQDLQRAAGGERPHIVFLSAPCKGFSGLLSEAKSLTDKYQALNRLTLRGVWLMLEAWADDPPELVLFENVPRLATRGRALLDRITAMLRSYGYAVAETTHDCGEIGGLAQSRKRFLLVARHIQKVPPMLYEPPRRALRGVGEVLGKLLLPGDERAGPMHRVPQLQWKTWVRLAFVEAGSDWRSLNRLAIDNGHLRDYLLVPEMHNGGLGVRRWDEPSGVVASQSRPANGVFSVADPRFDSRGNDFGQYGVLQWSEPAGAIINVKAPGQGAYTVADPRCSGTKHNNCFRVVRFDQATGTVTGGGHPSAGGQSVADPRPMWDRHGNNLVVTDWADPARAIIAGGKGVQGGWLSVADPRTGMPAERAAYQSGGHYGVIPWDQHAGAVSAAACHDNGRWSVADPRLPALDERLVAVIRAEDGTWHRPFTTLELAALQTLFDVEDPADVAAFSLDSDSDTQCREWIGNAVPCDAAQAMAEEMGRTLLLAWSGETFSLSAQAVWVKPYQVAVSLAQGGEAA